MKFIPLIASSLSLIILISCSGSGSSSSASGTAPTSGTAPDTSNTYTSFASALQSYIAADQAGSSSTDNKSSSMNSSIILGADYFADIPAIMTANYGYGGYMGVDNLTDNGATTIPGCGSPCSLSTQQSVAYAAGVNPLFIGFLR